MPNGDLTGKDLGGWWLHPYPSSLHLEMFQLQTWALLENSNSHYGHSDHNPQKFQNYHSNHKNHRIISYASLFSCFVLHLTRVWCEMASERFSVSAPWLRCFEFFSFPVIIDPEYLEGFFSNINFSVDFLPSSELNFFIQLLRLAPC